jgi:hypothetical protein
MEPGVHHRISFGIEGFDPDKEEAPLRAAALR